MSLDFICFMLLTWLFLLVGYMFWQMASVLISMFIWCATVCAFIWAFHRAGII
jgi:hypothetical protein